MLVFECCFYLQMICCEGNAAFYEVGAMASPLEGWSVTHTCLPVTTQDLAEASVRFFLPCFVCLACMQMDTLFLAGTIPASEGAL